MDEANGDTERGLGPTSAGEEDATELRPPAWLRTELRPGTEVGEYRIVDKIGDGGMGTVYEAVHPVIRKRAAIKVVRDRFGGNSEVVRRFVQEARAVNEIGHPNIIDIFSFGALEDGRPYFVMEYIDGHSLAERLDDGPLALAEALDIIDQVLSAVEAAHRKGIVHRDLKPDNILLVPGERGVRAVLLDFGIAKLTTQELVRTRTGSALGTPLYMSPEQVRGRDVGPPADVYSLGAVMYEMVSGDPPFWADNGADLIVLQLEEAPDPLAERAPEVPPVLAALVDRMLAKPAEERPGIGEVRAVVTAALSAYAAGAVGAVPTPVPIASSAAVASAPIPVPAAVASAPIPVPVPVNIDVPVAPAPRAPSRWLVPGIAAGVVIAAAVALVVIASRHRPSAAAGGESPARAAVVAGAAHGADAGAASPARKAAAPPTAVPSVASTAAPSPSPADASSARRPSAAAHESPTQASPAKAGHPPRPAHPAPAADSHHHRRRRHRRAHRRAGSRAEHAKPPDKGDAPIANPFSL